MSPPGGRSTVRTLDAYRSGHGAIRGWMGAVDFHLFELMGRAQREVDVAGDVFEIGSFAGKSAILLGFLLRDGEDLRVCDLFGASGPGGTGSDEEMDRYAGLTRAEFERNYRAWHGAVPAVYECSSLELPSLGLPASHRIVHVDGSHLFDIVRADIDTARGLAAADAIVIFDDYRNFGHPGVSAAVWEAVAVKGLRPLVLSEGKLYGTWQGGAGVERFVAETADDRTLVVERHPIGGYEVLAVSERVSGLRRVIHGLLGPDALDALGRARGLVSRPRRTVT